MLLFLNPTIKTQWKVWLFIQTFHCVFQHIHRRSSSFTTLWIYTILKLLAGGRLFKLRFTTLWIYTILKRWRYRESPRASFTTLWIHTILKQHLRPCKFPAPFHYLMDLHYSQTNMDCKPFSIGFHYLMNSHYSQTIRGHDLDCRRVSLPYEFTLFSNAAL